MSPYLAGAIGAVALLGAAWIIGDMLTRPGPAPEHHVCQVCHDRGAFLDPSSAAPTICPWCDRGRRARAQRKRRNPGSGAA
jgi:hypothetical protein